MDEGGIKVSVGEVLGVFGGSVVLVPESTLEALSRTAHEAFVEAAEEATDAVVLVVPDRVHGRRLGPGAPRRRPGTVRPPGAGGWPRSGPLGHRWPP